MKILTTTPASGSTNVPLIGTITIKFSELIDPMTVDNSSVVVATKKSTFPLNVEAVTGDDFFEDSYTGIAKGTITTKDDTLTFTIADPLLPSATYNVYVSSHIKSLSGNLLEPPTSFSFITEEEDITNKIPAQIPTNVIIGTNVVTTPTNKFGVESSIPEADSFFQEDKLIELTFNKDIKESSLIGRIKIYIYDILSDKSPYRCKDTDYTLSVVNNVLEIVFSSELELTNKVIELKVLKGLESTDNESMASNYELTFVYRFDPYYSSIQYVRLYGGPLFENIKSINIALMLHVSSIEIDTKLKYKTLRDATTIKHLYAMWSTIHRLLLSNHQLLGSNMITKKLGDFSISLTNSGRVDLFNKLLRNSSGALKKLDDLIIFSGNSGIFQKNSANNNPDIGRLWPKYANFEGINSNIDNGEKNILVWDDGYTGYSSSEDNDDLSNL